MTKVESYGFSAVKKREVKLKDVTVILERIKLRKNRKFKLFETIQNYKEKRVNICDFKMNNNN